MSRNAKITRAPKATARNDWLAHFGECQSMVDQAMESLADALNQYEHGVQRFEALLRERGAETESRAKRLRLVRQAVCKMANWVEDHGYPYCRATKTLVSAQLCDDCVKSVGSVDDMIRNPVLGCSE